MINDISTIYNTRALVFPHCIRVGGGSVYATHTGSIDVLITADNGTQRIMTINDALIIDDFGSLLISLVGLKYYDDVHITRTGTRRSLHYKGHRYTLSTRNMVYSLRVQLVKPPLSSFETTTIIIARTVFYLYL
jgi:hypothetical protein